MSKFAFTLLLILSATLIVISQNRKGNIYVTSSGAIDGYDPVAYFIDGEALKGKDNITYEWEGSTWHFISEENKTLFMKNPGKYAPEYGGYCAFGMSQGYKAKIDPNAWTISNNKLYLNYNHGVKETWMKKQDALIKEADVNWEKIKEE